MSLREQKKKDKLERIKKAALDLFIEKGFENTTTREIARRAGIATGTLFLYAPDKHTLLFMIFKEKISGCMERGLAAYDPEKPLIDSLLNLFRPFFEMYSGLPEIGRLFVREILFLDGKTGEMRDAMRNGFLVRFKTLLKDARSRGEIADDIDSETLVTAIFALYGFNMIRWLKESKDHNPETGLEQLRKAIDLLLRGASTKQP